MAKIIEMKQVSFLLVLFSITSCMGKAKLLSKCQENFPCQVTTSTDTISTKTDTLWRYVAVGTTASLPTIKCFEIQVNGEVEEIFTLKMPYVKETITTKTTKSIQDVSQIFQAKNSMDSLQTLLSNLRKEIGDDNTHKSLWLRLWRGLSLSLLVVIAIGVFIFYKFLSK